jgi:proteic killer suppression protein
VIRSFRSKVLKRFAETGDASKLSVRNIDRLSRILRALLEASKPEDLDLPGFKFHRLKGELKRRYSVWVSGNYRVTFGWDEKEAIDVDLEDYH